MIFPIFGVGKIPSQLAFTQSNLYYRFLRPFPVDQKLNSVSFFILWFRLQTKSLH
jgi:hypothetical protein